MPPTATTLALPDTEAPVDTKMEFINRQLDDISSTGTPILDGLLLLGCGGYERLQGGTQQLPAYCKLMFRTTLIRFVGFTLRNRSDFSTYWAVLKECPFLPNRK